jgi:peptidoglycan/LPS O-acetylase OafA/YrhL
LDGVRGVAVLAILAFHMSFGLADTNMHHYVRGYFLSVDLFFVLSGMLITELIVADHLATNRAQLRDFYRRRSYRLLPTLVTFLVVAPIYFQLDRHAGRATIKNYISVLSYVDTGHLTYPWSIGISQIWTLIVEWEFYIFWPLALIIALRRGIDRRRIAYWTIGAALLVEASRATVYLAGSHNWNLSYYNGWLRFDDLLVGCVVGLLGSKPQAPPWLRTVAVVFLAAVLELGNFTQEWLYVGGMLTVSVATAIIVQPREKPWFFVRVLAWPPLVWVGKISYSLYIWSGTLVAEVAYQGRTWPTAARFFVLLLGSFALAIPSHYLIERRFRLPSRRAAGAETDPVAPQQDAASAGAGA